MNTHQMITRSPFCLLGLLGLALFSSPISAQVFESGPSDSEMFDTVISLPPDTNIGNRESAGGDGLTTQINVSAAGTVGDSFDANSGTEVNISGGIVGDEFDAFSGSEVNVSAGAIGNSFDANSGSLVNISGGSVGGSFDAFSGSVVNISGGTVGGDFDALPGSQVNLFGSDLFLDGISLDEDLIEGEAFTIENRDMTLTGLLADGSEFSFDLNSAFEVNEDLFSTGATLTVTLGSPQGPTILGDVNQNGVVDFSDIGPFIALLSSGSFLEEADFNQDGEVNFLDIGPFIEILSGN